MPIDPGTLTKLERNIAYHQAMADHYGEKMKAATPAVAPAPANGDRPANATRRPTASSHPPSPANPDKVLHDMHAGVVEQLTKLVRDNMAPEAILVAEATQTIRRNPSPDVKPNAGRFH